MDLKARKERFIQAWGTIGSNWGISRTMALIHALLLVSPEPLSADEVMAELSISRGNANMNLRALIDWGLVYKSLKSGERKDFFEAEKDMYKVTRAVIIQRKKRELEPLLRILDELSELKGDTEETKSFQEVIKDIKLFSYKADQTLETLVNNDSEWLVSTMMRMD